MRAVRARTRKGGENVLQALAALLRKNQQRYGGYIVHLGVGARSSSGLPARCSTRSGSRTCSPGGSFSIGPIPLRLSDRQRVARAALRRRGRAARALPRRRSDQPLAVMAPEKRMYWLEQQPASIPSVYSTLREDLYVILTAIEHDGSATFKVYRNPLVNWIWIGGAVFVLGTLARDVAAPARAAHESIARGARGAVALAVRCGRVRAGAQRRLTARRPTCPPGRGGRGSARARHTARGGDASTSLYALSPEGNAGLRQGAQRRAAASFAFERVSNATRRGVSGRRAARRDPVRRPLPLRSGRARAPCRARALRADPDGAAPRATGVEHLRVERGCTHLRVNQTPRDRQPRRSRRVHRPSRSARPPRRSSRWSCPRGRGLRVGGGRRGHRAGRAARALLGAAVSRRARRSSAAYGLPLATPRFAVGFPAGAPPVAGARAEGRRARSPRMRCAACPSARCDGQHYAASGAGPIAAGGSLDARGRRPRRRRRAGADAEARALARARRRRARRRASGSRWSPKAPARRSRPRPSRCSASRCRPGTQRAALLDRRRSRAGLRRDPSGELAIPDRCRAARRSSRSPTGCPPRAAAPRSSSASIARAAAPVLGRRQRRDRGRPAPAPAQARARDGDRELPAPRGIRGAAGRGRRGLALQRTAPATPAAAPRSRASSLIAGARRVGSRRPLRGKPQPRAASRRAKASGGRAGRRSEDFERESIVSRARRARRGPRDRKALAEDHAAMRAALRAQAAALLLAPPRDATPAPEPRSRSRGSALLRRRRAPHRRFCSQCGSRLSTAQARAARRRRAKTPAGA